MKILLYIVIFLLLIALLTLSFLAGYVSEKADTFINSLLDISGHNLLSPIAVFLSATIASVAAFFGLFINGRRERKKWTLDHLGYKRFSWIGVRSIKPTLDIINANKEILNEEEFVEYMDKLRQNMDDDNFRPTMDDDSPKRVANDDAPENSGYSKVISYLDSYQQMAFGVQNNLYHEETARLVCSDKAIFVYEKSKSYINWRRNAKFDGIADESEVYLAFEQLALKWKEIRDKEKK